MEKDAFGFKQQGQQALVAVDVDVDVDVDGFLVMLLLALLSLLLLLLLPSALFGTLLEFIMMRY